MFHETIHIISWNTISTIHNISSQHNARYYNDNENN